jgi:hypothetical protein
MSGMEIFRKAIILFFLGCISLVSNAQSPVIYTQEMAGRYIGKEVQIYSDQERRMTIGELITTG